MQKRHSKQGLFVTITALLSFSFSTNSFADVGIDVMGLAGFGNTTNTALQMASGVSFGGRAAYHLNPKWEVGASYTNHSSFISLTINAVTSPVTNNWQFFLADINRHLFSTPALKPLYAGLLGGVGLNNVISPNPVFASVSTSLTFGARAGYDYEIDSGFSAGAEVRYAITLSSALATTFAGYAVLKYGF